MSKIAGFWLLSTASGVAGLIVLGGYTRLKRAGLSMVEWKPHTWGYPRNEEEWDKEFKNYQRFPEFQISQPDMTLKEFQDIYFIEWAHRTYAKGLGLYFAVPLALFWKRGSLLPAVKKTLGFALALGSFQGFIGWWMVKSGLESPNDDSEFIRVRHTRLAVHQGLGLSLYSLVFWSALTQLRPTTEKVITTLRQYNESRFLRNRYMLAVHLLAGALFTGALVAGTDAGKKLANWPWYGDDWVFPSGAFDREPVLDNFLHNRDMIQFSHRTLAYLTGLTIFDVWWASRSMQIGRTAARLALLAVGLQGVLGVTALYRACALPESLTHQGNAILLLSCILAGLHGVRKPPNFKKLL